jgi:protein-S-isoprenylcysteine O-methyltransferase Ste14
MAILVLTSRIHAAFFCTGEEDGGAGMPGYTKWAKKEHSFGRRMMVMLLVAPLFLLLLPYVVGVVGARWDSRLGIPSYWFGLVNILSGGAVLAAGVFFAMWSIGDQLTRGRGTPLPMMPTQELLTQGPFRLCRNPMTLGTILMYSGLAIAAGTTMGLAFVFVLALLLMLYLKRMEEPELAERFGEAYLAYKREVPFMLPRLWRRGGNGGGARNQ